jgi:predicted AAA+ superfamily ATPase
VGKSTWLKKTLTGARHLDLLESSLYLELSRDPSRLEAMLSPLRKGSWVVLDEIQKVPELLDAVHRLIESRGWRFALCGSSARKLRRRGTNLLGGRALTCNMEAFSAHELGARFDLGLATEWGTLPSVSADVKNAADLLDSYVNTYIKEEIREEGIVRSVPPFLRFLAIAGQINGQSINGANIARDAGVPRANVDVYFSILVDTLLGHFLPAYRPQAKVREQSHPKFYWFDPGVARAAAGLHRDPADRAWKGFALETLLYHELRVYNETRKKHRGIFYYRTGADSEIDFIIETRKKSSSSKPHLICLEVKISDKWDRKWERSMRSLKESGSVTVDRMIGLYTGRRAYQFDELAVMPIEIFLGDLWRGKVF